MQICTFIFVKDVTYLYDIYHYIKSNVLRSNSCVTNVFKNVDYLVFKHLYKQE